MTDDATHDEASAGREGDPRERRRARRARGRARSRLRDDPQPGQSIGRYIVHDTLGRGAMGVVVRAYDHALDRKVALKLLHADVTPRRRQRLRREAQALARLSHPNVVRVFDVGEHEGRTFIAMELVDGRTLRAWQGSGPHPWRQVVRTYLQAARGLAAAHADGLIHRDFKPDNCILGDDGRARVLDFGLVRDALESSSSAALERASASGDGDEDEGAEAEAEPATLTRTGAVLGTPAYMSPEQSDGRPATPASDQFAFCVSLFEALYGRRPFTEASQEATARARAEGRMQAPTRTKVPAKVLAILERGLAPSPADRWPSMDELVDALERASSGRGWVRVLGASSVGVAAATIVVLQPWKPADARACDDVGARLGGAWDEERAEQVRSAFAGTRLSYAEDSGERVRARLDAYAEAWGSAYRAACKAGRDGSGGHRLDLTMACLEQRRDALEETTAVLLEADAGVVDEAVSLVSSLPRVSSCEDPAELDGIPAPPEDPAVADRARHVRRRLTRARALLDAGRFDAGWTIAEAATATAETMEHPPLLAEAMLLRGLARARHDRTEEAEHDLEAAFALASEHDHDAVATAAAAHLAKVTGMGLARPEDGERWARTALSLAQRRPGATLEQATAHGNLGLVLAQQGRLDEALTELTRTLELREAELGPRHLLVANTVNNLGNVRYQRGELEQAIEQYRRSLEIKRHALGPRHPAIANTLTNLSNVHVDQGRPKLAIEQLEQALAIYTEAQGPEHSQVADVHNNLGNALAADGQGEEAAEHLRRAAAIYERTGRERHPALAHTLLNLGSLLLDLGDPAAAETPARRAVEIYEEAFGPEHPAVGQARGNLGLIAIEQARWALARTQLERAVEIFEAAELPFDLAMARHGLGRLALAQGDLDSARTRCVAAEAGLSEQLGPRHPAVAGPVVTLAEVELAQGRPSVAQEHAERALASTEGATELTMVRTRVAARFVLARALWSDPAQRDRALHEARRAREEHDARGDHGRQRRTELDAWLGAHDGSAAGRESD